MIATPFRVRPSECGPYKMGTSDKSPGSVGTLRGADKED